MASESTIEYQRLSVLKAKIRRVHIASLASDAGSDDIVQCTLEHVPLGNPPPYVALSYCWGSTTNTADIIVSDRRVSVTMSLETALRRLRSNGDLVIWADALCINWLDWEERSLQILRMGAIYRRAKSVSSWLGSWETSELAVSCLKSLANWEETRHEYNAKPLEKVAEVIDWVALRSFFQQPYWSQVWIVQEMSFGQNLKILCGDAPEVSLEQLVATIQVCERFVTFDIVSLCGGKWRLFIY
jgi:hypothetical protein